MITAEDSDVCVISEELAEKNNLSVGRRRQNFLLLPRPFAQGFLPPCYAYPLRSDVDQSSDLRCVSLIGSKDMSLDTNVLSGNVTIKEGRMITAEDSDVCVISEELAADIYFPDLLFYFIVLIHVCCFEICFFI